MNIKQSCYLISLCLVLPYLAQAQPAPVTLIDKIVAKVDGKIILQSELEADYQRYLHQGGQEVPNLKCKVLENLIVNKALLSKAQQEGTVVKNEEIDQELSRKMQYLVQQAGSEASLAQYWGKSIAEIRSELQEKIKENRTLEKMRMKIIKEIATTPQEVKTFFETLADQEIPYYPTEVVIRQIVQYPKASQQAKSTLIDQLKALKVRLQNGESFETLAQTYSQDPGSAPQGGELGFWRLGELAPNYEAAALALQPGEVSEPIETPFGIHLIQLITREKDRYNSRHILLKLQSEAIDLEATKASLAQLRASILAGKLTFEEAARASSEDTSTASIGGLLTGERGEIRQVIDNLPPDVFFVVEQLESGNISDPVVFSAPDNREAVRILLLEEKIAPHQASLAQDYAKIQKLLLNKKRATALQAWFEDVQQSASIEIAPEYQECELLK
ncbi:MAG: peptidylprolyl isomerase [Bacteroidota bacterium]